MIDPASNYNKLQHFVSGTECNEKQFPSRDFIGLISKKRRRNGERWLINNSIGKSNDNHEIETQTIRPHLKARTSMKTKFFHTAATRRNSKCPRLSSQSAFKPLQGIAARLLRDYRMHTRVFWIVSCSRCLSKRLLRVFTSARCSFTDHGIIEHFNDIARFFVAHKRTN